MVPVLGQFTAMTKDVTQLSSRIMKAVDRRRALGLAPGSTLTDAYRLVHKEADALAGLAVDIYGSFALAQFYESWPERNMQELFGVLLSLGSKGVYVKHRPKQANVIVDARSKQFSPAQPVAGEAAPFEFAIHEHGLNYQVRLYDGLSTGIFLDQRDNRQRVQNLSAGKRVLNLFSYTGAFSIAAGAGGALEVTNVDASKAAQALAKANVSASGVPGIHRYITEDAFVYLRRLSKRGQRFDVVILDPPSYAKTKASRFSSAQDYVKLLRASFEVVAAGGTLFACSNLSTLSSETFEDWARNAVHHIASQTLSIVNWPPPADFSAPPGTPAHLKTLQIQLR